MTIDVVPRALPCVGPQERELIAVARAVMGQGSFASIEPTLASAVTIERLGPSAMGILEDTLAKGVVKMLARLGGAEPRLRPGASASAARVFEVRGAPVLAFGPYTFELLRWLTASALDDPSTTELDAIPRTLGDHVVAYLALRLVVDTRLERVVARQPALRRSSLAWLGHAGALARKEHAGEPPAIAELLALDDARTVVECLAGDLAQRWIRASRVSTDSGQLAIPDALRIGAAQQRTLTDFLDALERLGRWDLATFLVDAGTRLLKPGTTTSDVAARALAPVSNTGLLRERTEVRRRSGAVFHALGRIGARREQLSLVRFFEDGYDEAQLLLGSWEPLGREGFARAADVVRTLAALDAPASDDKEEK